MSENKPETKPETIRISQSVAILVDGNNIERSLKEAVGDANVMPNFDTLVPRLLGQRGLNRLVYFREGKNISDKLRERLHSNYHGSVRPCHKSADIPLTIKATQLASKVDTIIIMSGDSDFIELVRHLKGEGVRVEIAAVPETTSRLLLEDADYFHTLDKDDCYYLEARKPQRQARPKRTRQPRKQDPAPANKTGQDGQSQKSRAAQGQKPGAAQGQKPGAAKGPAEQASQGTAAKAPEKKTQAKRRPRRQTKAKAPADDNAGNR